jgi:hypothetical protein
MTAAMSSCMGASPTAAVTLARREAPSSRPWAMTSGMRLSWASGLPCQER